MINQTLMPIKGNRQKGKRKVVISLEIDLKLCLQTNHNLIAFLLATMINLKTILRIRKANSALIIA